MGEHIFVNIMMYSRKSHVMLTQSRKIRWDNNKDP